MCKYSLFCIVYIVPEYIETHEYNYFFDAYFTFFLK